MCDSIAIIGASDKPQRYSFKAMEMLEQYGYQVFLVNPFRAKIGDRACYATVLDVPAQIDTVTLYVNPVRFRDHLHEVIELRPRRVIMNPGTEDAGHSKLMQEAGILVEEACTLVLLSMGRF